MHSLIPKSFHKKKHPNTPHSNNNPCYLYVIAITTAATILFLFYSRQTDPEHLCSTPALTTAQTIIADEFTATAIPLVTIFHYATARDVPQQSKGEIRRPFDVLQSLAPCNFLVFGIGHDALMWDSFNPRGITLFLEEDRKWTISSLKRFPILRAHTVHYNTRLTEAQMLLSSYKKDCGAVAENDHPLKDDRKCRLALSELPKDVYDRDWDVVMIDAPRGYFASAPGRMAAIYSVAVMARARKKAGVTHVFLHDVDREVEKLYAKEFLCMKYRVGGIRKLWHFVIPPAVNVTDTTNGFC
ncbi:arabinogalactan O-methyltransferase 1-like [Cicer arietinum]|uniref:Probable methyltransferase At1g27930 n=1 Tax=Cicer arietinum TaxID=3827 RepID=A0A1S2Z1I2_CICAR|nr:probable methyltransferase At1g27930 [Cicer arietinum]